MRSDVSEDLPCSNNRKHSLSPVIYPVRQMRYTEGGTYNYKIDFCSTKRTLAILDSAQRRVGVSAFILALYIIAKVPLIISG